MEEKKRIDRLFQEKLKDYEVFPEPHVWKNIQQEIMEKKRRRIVPLWLRFGSAAAVLLLLISTGFWYFDQGDSLPNHNITVPSSVDSEADQPAKEENSDQNNSTKQIQNTTTTDQKNTSFENDERIKSTSSEPQKSSRSTFTDSDRNPVNSTAQANEPTNVLANNDNVEKEREENKSNDQKIDQKLNLDNKDFIDENTAITNNQTKEEDFQLTKNDIAEAIEDQLNEEKNTIDKQKKWSVGTAIAPVYYNSLSKGSPINMSLASNDKEANTSLSYGVKLNYQINEKLSLQSGINNVELAYKTQGVTALIASSELQFSDGNLDTNIDGVNLIAISNNQVAAQSSELGAQRGVVNLRGDLNQSLSYIEIPMEAKYALLNKKLGIHVVGGVSTYVLYGNKISLLDQNGSTTLGEASNINDINFSGNLGLDLDYNLNKKLFINVSPMFKYQMNTFSKNDGGFKPYYLGVYTGLNFRF